MNGIEPDDKEPGSDEDSGSLRTRTRTTVMDRRLQLLADVLTFQIKLTLDGLRDVVLVPVSLIAGIVGLIRGGDEPDLPFRQILALGRRSERWINLFGHHEGNTADALLQPIRQGAVARVQQAALNSFKTSGHSPDASASVEIADPATHASRASPPGSKTTYSDDAPAG